MTSSESGTPAGTQANVRVRFAPSPTGYLHVGGARTALFNWLFARNQGGAFILRIEDTDLERNRPELVDGIIDGLRWLGLNWDEGPFYQSRRLSGYAAAAEKLVSTGAAYLCYCAPEKYAGGDSADASVGGKTEMRRITRCSCREGKPLVGNQSPAVRFRVPLGVTTHFDDAVFGPRELQNDEIEDFVLLRSAKNPDAAALPTYQLGAVVDDIDMRITHVIRGADHLSNTPKQILLYRALGATPPIFAHVPLILGPDRTRLSKRHGATSVSSYRDEGFLPEAFRNFLALLGWSGGDDTEMFRTAELIQRFSLAGVSRTNAVFDRAKLEWFNQQYLQKLPIEELLPAVQAQLEKSGLWRAEWAGAQKDWFARTVDLLRPRTRLLPDFSHWSRAFFTDDFEYDAAAREKFWKDERLPDLLARLTDELDALPEWNHDACDRALRQLAEKAGVKAALLINATRVALVGQPVAPPLFDTMVVLGKERVITRLRRAVPALSARSVAG
ncbi:MAG TPA: glutamate--tRNA ligase [Terriglobales bacterium]|nr:glutamate--tRNA ligase [Terriglobales bacterium]HZR63869.1 glutamate--tRNA ligase [Terriglobales bacterium]